MSILVLVDERLDSDSFVAVVVAPLAPFPERELDPHLWYLPSTLPSSAFHLYMLSYRRTSHTVDDRL